MALAVAEAHRLLRPGGTLLDLHPEGAPLRLEAWRALGRDLPGNRDPAGFAREVLGDLGPEAMAGDFAASTQALAGAAQHGLVHDDTVRFDYRFFFDTLDDLTTYLEENEEMELAGDALLERALLALQAARTPAQLVLVQPVAATRLRKP
jgi:hypothetical protein